MINDFHLIYNPENIGGVILLDPKAWAVYSSCKNNLFGDIIEKQTNIEYAKEVITALRTKGMLLRDGKQPVFSWSKKPITQAWLQITNRCNLRCPYCYIKKNTEDMSDEVLWGVLNKLEEEVRDNKDNVSGLRLKFGGGEPLLRFAKIREIVEYYKNKDLDFPVHFGMITNGTVMNKEIASFIKDNKIPVSISLDGIAKEHNKTRIYPNGDGSFSKIVQALDLLQNQGVRPYILITITSKNLEGLPELVKFLNSRKLAFRFSLFKDYNVSDDELIPNTSDLLKVINECYDIMEYELPEFNLGRVHLNGISFNRPFAHGCPVGRNSAFINYDGSISLCQLTASNPVSYYTRGIRKPIQNQKQFTFRYQANPKDIKCKECQWDKLCAGVCPLIIHKKYGNCLEKSPYCEFYKVTIPRVIKIIGLQLYKQYNQINQ